VKWIDELGQKVAQFMGTLPTNLNKLSRSQNLMLNPLFRFLEREVTVCSNLLELVRKRLGEVKQMADGKIQPLQELKQLAQTIHRGSTPKAWLKYTVPVDLDMTGWIADFKKRLAQFEKLTNTKDWRKSFFN
jgi:dynein heavy chain 1